MAFEELNPPKGRGRPSLLEAKPDIGDELASKLRKGMFLREACALVGVSRDSVYKLLKQGNKDIDHEDYDTPEARFTVTIKKAQAEAEEEHLENIQRAGKQAPFWAASAWYLERAFPDRFGRRDRMALEHTGKMAIANVEQPLNERLDTDEKREAAKRIADSLAITGESAVSPNWGAYSSGEFGNEWESEDAEASTLPEWETD